MTSEVLDRLPPQNIEAEKNLLGALIVQGERIDRVAPHVAADDFYSDANQRLFKTLCRMTEDGDHIDLTLLAERLRREGEYEAVGGAAYLVELMDNATVLHLLDFAKIVRQKARKRRIIAAASEMLRNAYDEAKADSEIIAEAEEAIGLIDAETEERETWTAAEAVQAAFDNIDETIRRGETTGLPTGFRTFDEEIGGLFPGELTILGARSSVGKTAMAMQIAQWNAAKGRLVYFVTLEMSLLNLMTRELCAAANVNSVKVRSGRLDSAEREKILAAGIEIAKGTLVIDDRTHLKVSDIHRKAKQLAKQELRLVIVDYAQFVTPDDTKAVREQQVAGIAKGLKRLAKKLNVSVVVLAALNKEAEKQGSAKLSHLRESDAQGFTADVVMTLERGEKGTDKECEAFLKVLKNRNGPTGKFEMEWIPHRTRFACKGEDVPDPITNLPTNRERAFDGYSEF